MEKNPSTQGMTTAIGEALAKWESNMAASLVKLKTIMTPEEWKSLELSQKTWEKYREAELKTQAEIYSRMEGTMWRPVSSTAAMDLTRKRALLLTDYATTISER